MTACTERQLLALVQRLAGEGQKGMTREGEHRE